MAVITQFVVVREGVEKMTFTSKKEADAYDKMLDVVDSLVPFLSASELNLDENTCEQLAFYLATNKDELGNLLKGVVKPKSIVEPKPKKKTVKQD
ncbi:MULTISPECIES: YebG family protein [Shewanella]|jgi:dsDNA-binding SOS-regulon protein|uniref:YebG family protein n=1 Tax=Shewanella holmiensis TaxID=2952222 RepID=A0A9X2WIY6_9GAMM|nr:MULTISPECIES: YebG family protein [Shewanella]MCT7940215.1 YebG family protein [Shewanella holmiensis]MDP5147154.1 YebG family protein [Shewanella sp. ULN5]